MRTPAPEPLSHSCAGCGDLVPSNVQLCARCNAERRGGKLPPTPVERLTGDVRRRVIISDLFRILEELDRD